MEKNGLTLVKGRRIISRKWWLLAILSVFLYACKGTKGAQQSGKEQLEIVCQPILQGGTPSRSPVLSMQSKFESECLVIEVTYSGGCEDHEFDLYWNGITTRSLPPQTSLFLSHNDNGDACRSIERAILYFDLVDLKPVSGGVVVNLSAAGVDPVRFEYGIEGRGDAGK